MPSDPPVEPATDVAVPEPEPPPAVTPVVAIDGEARGYEVAPEASHIRGGFVWRGLGTGVGYVVRAILLPFRGIVYMEARWHTWTRLRKLLVNEAGTAGIYPTASYATSFGLSYGLKAFVDDYFGADEKISVSAKTGGAVSQAYQFKLELPHLGGSPIYLNARVRYEDNSNLLFAGIGNPGENGGVMQDAMATQLKTRFSQQRFLTVLATGVQIGRGETRFKIGGSAIFNDRSFGEGDSQASDPSIETVYDTSTLRGFEDGFQNLELTGNVELDTRNVKGKAANGGVVRAFAGGGSLVEDVKYMHYGGEAAYLLTPFLPGRTFVGRVALEGIRDEDHDVPFTELPRIGGAGLLRGYSTDQFRGNLSTVATLEYHWPIHALLSGDVFVETGKVAMNYDELVGDGLKDDWHVGYGGGLIVHSKSGAVKVRLDIAYGDGLNFYFSTDVLDAFRRRENEL